MSRLVNVRTDLYNSLDISVNVAKEAALSIPPDIDRSVTTDLGRDVKVKADTYLNKIIIERLTEKSPYPVLSEEEDFSKNRLTGNGYLWIVDPLDGSLNFSRSIPLCCISIALWKEMEPLIGVVYDFNRDEMFTGMVGEGAWLNGKQINIRNVEDKNNAILCTGFPVNTDFSDKALLDFVRDVQSYKKIRLLGSAALSLAYVASGRADIYHEKDIAIWDVAAGIAIVKASGGNVQFNPSKDENRLIVKAANNLLLSVN